MQDEGWKCCRSFELEAGQSLLSMRLLAGSYTLDGYRAMSAAEMCLVTCSASLAEPVAL